MPDRRDLPRVDALCECKALAPFPRKLRLEAARAALAALRDRKELPTDLRAEAERIAAEVAERRSAPSLRPIINASGVILHTGAGRARLAKEAAAQVALVADSHSNLEIDLDSGKRGDRQEHVRDLLTRLTGAEEAFVVNNCAAAVFLCLRALANRKEVLLSRGQMVEIGGSFRLPDIVRQSGCKLVEIGTTNKTRIEDYENAVTARTALILRCHPSNYRVVGFAEAPALEDLVKLSRDHGLILMDDVGSGCLIDTTSLGLPAEPRIQDSIARGADVVTSSADKLLGGPQAGLILGNRDPLQRIRKHPLARIVRAGKLTLAALEATLRLHWNGQDDLVPTMRYLMRTKDEVKGLAEQLQHAYRGDAVLSDGITEVGGGSLPGVGIPTVRVGLAAKNPTALATALRKSKPPVLTRVEEGRVWIDPRTLELAELSALKTLLGKLS